MKTFVNHVYDIDIINIYNLLDNKLSKDTSEKGKANKKEFLERLVYSIRQIIEVDKEGYKITIDEYDSLPSYVITPDKNFDNYIYWLGLFLLANPSLKTHLILEYHFNRWSNKMMLLNIIEFYVIDNVDENFFLQDETVVKYVSDWVLLKRIHSGYSNPNPNSPSDSTHTNKNKEKKYKDLIFIDDIEYKTKENKFPERGDESISSTEKNVSVNIVLADKVGEVLLSVLTERLFDKTNINNLELLLLQNKSSGHIALSISQLDLIGLFKELIDKGGYVYKGSKRKVAKWICSNFKTDNVKDSSKGEFNLKTTINRLSDKTYLYDEELVSKVIEEIEKLRAGIKD